MGETGRITLRPATAEDDALLRRLYASTRDDELSRVDWSDAQKRAFLEMQFDAQDRHYRARFPQARFDVIERDGDAVGRLIVDRVDGEIRLLDIALLPANRGAGIGGRLLRALCEEAAAAGCAVTLHVERTNPAQRLYERLGFRTLREDGIRRFLEWRADAGTQAKTHL